MKKNLTKSQEEVLLAIKTFKDKNSYSPTVRELCEILKLKSSATVFTHLKHLKEKGYLTMVKGKSRTIKITED